jgi:hypothetical protein
MSLAEVHKAHPDGGQYCNCEQALMLREQLRAVYVCLLNSDLDGAREAVQLAAEADEAMRRSYEEMAGPGGRYPQAIDGTQP